MFALKNGQGCRSTRRRFAKTNGRSWSPRINKARKDRKIEFIPENQRKEYFKTIKDKMDELKLPEVPSMLSVKGAKTSSSTLAGSMGMQVSRPADPRESSHQDKISAIGNVIGAENDYFAYVHTLYDSYPKDVEFTAKTWA